jgi:hypothetical protein
MESSHSLPTTNGQAADSLATATIVVKQRRRLARKLLKDLAAFTGVAVNELAPSPRPDRPRRQSSRLLYRLNLTDAELDRLLVQIGIDRWWAAFERATKPRVTAKAPSVQAAVVAS